MSSYSWFVASQIQIYVVSLQLALEYTYYINFTGKNPFKRMFPQDWARCCIKESMDDDNDDTKNNSSNNTPSISVY
jgi:hypothetical protein